MADGGFGAFAGGGGFASLASAASSTATPAFAEAGSGDEIKKDNVLVFGQSDKSEKIKPFASLAGPTQTFGSGTPNKSTLSTSNVQIRLGQVALSSDKKPPTPSEEKRIVTAFGQKFDPDAKPSSLWASAAGGSGAASAFFNTKPHSNKSPFGSFSSQAAGQKSSVFRSSGTAFAPYESKRDSESGSDGEVLSESEGGTKTTKGPKNKGGYLTPDEEEADEEEHDEEEEEEEGDGDEGEEAEEEEEEEEEEEGEEGEDDDLAEVSDEDEGLPVVAEGDEEEQESESTHEEDGALSSTPKGGIKTTFQWKQGALDNAANARPASSPSQKIPWQGSSEDLGVSSRAKASSPSHLPQVATSIEPKPANSVITPVPKLATSLFSGSDVQSAGNAPTKISARPKTPPGLFGAGPTTASTMSQSDLQSKMVNITPMGSTTPKPQPMPPNAPTTASPRSKYQELQDQLNAMLTNALGHNDEVSRIILDAASVSYLLPQLERRVVSLRNAMEKSRSPAMRPKTTQEDLETSVWTFGDLPAMCDTIRSSKSELLELVDTMFTVQKGLADLQRLVLKSEPSVPLTRRF